MSFSTPILTVLSWAQAGVGKAECGKRQKRGEAPREVVVVMVFLHCQMRAALLRSRASAVA